MPSSNAFEGVGFSTPALIGIDTSNAGSLEFWPIRPGGGTHPSQLTGRIAFGDSGAVADGNVVAASGQSGVMLYNIKTKISSTLPNPYGSVVDLAIDRHHNIFAATIGGRRSGIVMYPRSKPAPKLLICAHVGIPEAVAADDEGNIFVNGYTPNNVAAVVEIPNGPSGPDPQHCVRLQLRSERGYVAGIAVDPKTDDLIVLDDPDYCAGGVEGRMTIYPKPYAKGTAVSHNLGANCASLIRLNADSTLAFVLDEDVSGSYTFILQRSYPDGADMGSYTNGNTGGFTTIPNVLPN